LKAKLKCIDGEIENSAIHIYLKMPYNIDINYEGR